MIYDCFTFFNELDLLEIRLNVLNDVVDKFVLVEMDKTHSNNDKPFYFEENKERYAEFLHKIVHVKVTDYPSKEEIEKTGNPYYNWFLENYQRNAILRGLENVQLTDFILLSDLDEIPNPKVVARYEGNDIWVFKQKTMYYYLNNLCITSPVWKGTRMGTIRRILELQKNMGEVPKEHVPCYFRGYQGKEISYGGWHFSYLGGVEKIIHKIQSFAHQEYNTEEYLNPEKILKHIENNENLYGQKGVEFKVVELNSSFPKYILDNQEKYKQLIKECP